MGLLYNDNTGFYEYHNDMKWATEYPEPKVDGTIKLEAEDILDVPDDRIIVKRNGKYFVLSNINYFELSEVSYVDVLSGEEKHSYTLKVTATERDDG